jgi:hypothetical protein
MIPEIEMCAVVRYIDNYVTLFYKYITEFFLSSFLNRLLFFLHSDSFSCNEGDLNLNPPVSNFKWPGNHKAKITLMRYLAKL